MLVLGKAERTLPARALALERALADGSALDRGFPAHGQRPTAATRASSNSPNALAGRQTKLEVLAPRSGYIADCDAYALGIVAVALGAGRTRADQAVDAHRGHRASKPNAATRRPRPTAVRDSRAQQSPRQNEAAARSQRLQSLPPKPKAKRVSLISLSLTSHGPLRTPENVKTAARDPSHAPRARQSARH